MRAAKTWGVVTPPPQMRGVQTPRSQDLGHFATGVHTLSSVQRWEIDRLISLY